VTEATVIGAKWFMNQRMHRAGPEEFRERMMSDVKAATEVSLRQGFGDEMGRGGVE